MEPSANVLAAMLHCSYKAWRQSRDETGHGIAFSEASSQKITIKLQKQLTDARLLINREEPPSFYQNKHCPECQFQESCYAKLKERDCISLLGNMPPKTIEKFHKKGIFSVLQLSHLFRPRRRGRRKPTMSSIYLWELKALALREQKTYVMHLPEVQNLSNAIYIDFEGTEDAWIYLIGVILKQEGKTEQVFSFWANSRDEEERIFAELFQLLKEHPDSTIFHFGSYETRALRQVVKRYPKLSKTTFTQLEKQLVNVLVYFRSYVYPPTYSNGLKEIAKYLGFEWAIPDATGLQSLEWRKQWETSEELTIKEQLILYNRDDCSALEKVNEWLQQLATGRNEAAIERVAEMKKESPYKFQNNPEFGEDYNYINKASYFDYQRSKIYWRNKKAPPPSLGSRESQAEKASHRGRPIWVPGKVHENIYAQPLKKCPKCGNSHVYQLKKSWRGKVQTDLKFTSTGIVQHIVKYWSMQAKCPKCNHRYNNVIVKKFHYGDKVFAWAINLYVNYHISHEMICRILFEQFGIWMNYVYLIRAKGRWWTRWEPEVDYVRKTVFNSPVLHIDETTIKLSKDKGYVWVFATPNTVFYHFTLTRETNFLQQWLKGYGGVIITDFFPGYDSLSVKRQKCLIHLIRDLNDDLYKNPFDDEFRTLVAEFGKLLRSVIQTVDKYGLQKKRLEKYTREVNAFVAKHLDRTYKDELATKYVKRLKKHWDEIWTFLHHDNVPWNNNNAEAAVKAFAQHRRGVNGQMNERGIRQYLEMLSLSQTCRYRNLSFLDLLRRKTGLWKNVQEEEMPGILPFDQARSYVRSLNFERKRQWTDWKQSGKRPKYIPSNPEVKYKNNGWISWHDWLGFSFMSFEKARTYMRRLGLKNRNEYWIWSTSGKRPKTIPASPEKEYKYTGWKDLGDWLGTGNTGQQRKPRMTYSQAKTYIQALGITTQKEFFEWRKSGQRPETVPPDPERVYRAEFEGWGKFLGTNRVANQHKAYCNYEEAKELIKPLRIKSAKHFRELCALGFIPENIPRSPWAYYKRRNEWVSFPDFWEKN